MSIHDINSYEGGRIYFEVARAHNMTITVLGCRRSGKSSLVRRLVDGGFNPKDVIEAEESTFLDSFYRANLDVNGEGIFVDILDTGTEHEDFKNRRADGYIIVYSITDKQSYIGAHEWLKAVGKNSPVILVGCKCDLDQKRKIEKSEGEDLAIQYEAKFMEASAKVKINEIEIFRECIREIQNPIKDALKVVKSNAHPDCCTIL